MNIFRTVLVAAMGAAFASAASATVISFVGTPTSGEGLTTTISAATVVTFNEGSALPSGITYSGAGKILGGSKDGYYATPAGDNSLYLSVAYPDSTGTEIAQLGSQYNYFGLYWGSMDDYNTLSFYNGDKLLNSYTGAQVIANGTALGDQSAMGSNRYVNFFFGPETYNKVVFDTKGFAFESDNHAYANVSVPEPGTLALMAVGLLGAALTARRRKLKAQ